MKCQYCGTNLGLEDEKCPHCGNINTLATRYVEEIKEYKEDLEETGKEVKAQVKISGRLGRLIVIIVMILIIAIMEIKIRNLSDFDNRLKQNNEKTEQFVSKYQDDIETNLRAMEKNRDYLAFDYYVSNYQLRTNEIFDEYIRVETAAIDYEVIYSDILNIVTGNNRYGERTNRDYCADIAIYVAGYKYYAEGEFWHDSPDSPLHAGEHGAFIKDAKKDIQDMIQVYFELDDTQAAGIWEMEEEKLAELLYSRCQNLYPEGGSNE